MHGTFTVSEVSTRDPSVTPVAQERTAQRNADVEAERARLGLDRTGNNLPDADPTESRIVLYPQKTDGDDLAVAEPARYIELVAPTDQVEDLQPGALVKLSVTFEVLEAEGRPWAVHGGRELTEEEARNVGDPDPNTIRNAAGPSDDEREDAEADRVKAAKADADKARKPNKAAAKKAESTSKRADDPNRKHPAPFKDNPSAMQPAASH